MPYYPPPISSTPTGAAGGSLKGTYPNPSLADVNAIATSLAIGGATIGTDALGVTGTATFSTGVIGGSFAVTSSTVPSNGIYLSAANTVSLTSSTNLKFSVGSTTTTTVNNIVSNVAGSFQLGVGAASATVPTIIPNKASTTTGFGAQASGNISGIASGAEIVRITTTAFTQIAGQTVLKAYIVSTLPTGITGGFAYVTDALAPTFLATVVGGGAVTTPVFYNGANWVGA